MNHFNKVIGEAKRLKSSYDSHRRAAKTDALNVLEISLEARERAIREEKQRLTQLEQELNKQAASIQRQRRRPTLVLVACVIVGVIGIGVVSIGYELVPRAPGDIPVYPAAPAPSSTATTSSSVAADEAPPYPDGVQPSFSDMQTKYGSGEDFDVGRYCLDEEAKGGLTFEQCLGAAAVALRNR